MLSMLIQIELLKSIYMLKISKIGVFSKFLAIFGCITHFKSELAETIQQRLGQPA